MKRSRFSEEQIIAILKEQEAGMATADVCRRHGISSATFYKWKSKYGGMEASDLRRVKELEAENAEVLDENSGGNPQPVGVRRCNGKLFFGACEPATGCELWTSDGTSAGTQLFRDIFPGVRSGDPRFLKVVGDDLFFRACDEATRPKEEGHSR